MRDLANIKAYLAGPDVFLEDALEVGARKKRICNRYGLDGVFPLDPDIADTVEEDRGAEACADLSARIYQLNIELIDDCDLVIANMTPFRGPSMDVGTAFEMGYAVRRNVPIFGYSFDTRSYETRVMKFYKTPKAGKYDSSATAKDPYGRTIENFGLPDNLMLFHCLTAFFDVSESVDDKSGVQPIHDDFGFDVVVGHISRRVVAANLGVEG